VPSYKQLEVGQTEHRLKMKITTHDKKVDRYEDKISNTDATTYNLGEIVQSEQYEPAT
jgi:hypothetical protein